MAINKISGVTDKSVNAYIFRMSGNNFFNYIDDRYIQVTASGELLNKETNFIDLNKPIRAVFIHRGFQNPNTVYVPFTLNCSGSKGISKLTAIYEPTGNDLGNVSWGVIPTGGVTIGPNFKINNYERIYQNNQAIVDQWFYSGNTTLGTTGSSFVRHNDIKNLLSSTPISNNVINLQQPGSTIGVSGLLTNNYSYDLAELLIINRDMTDLEKWELYSHLCSGYGACDGYDIGSPSSSSSSSSSEEGSSSSSEEGSNFDGGGANGSAAGGSASGDPIWKFFVRVIDLNSVTRNSEGQITSFTTYLVQRKYLDVRNIQNLSVLQYLNNQTYSNQTFNIDAGVSKNLPGVLTKISVNNNQYTSSEFNTSNNFVNCVGCWTARVNGYQILFKVNNLQNATPQNGLLFDFYEQAFAIVGGVNTTTQNRIRYTHNMLSLVGLSSGPINASVPILDTNNPNAKWELASNFVCNGCNVKDPILWNKNYPCSNYNSDENWGCEPCDPACPNYDQSQEDNSAGGQKLICCSLEGEANNIKKSLCDCYGGSEVPFTECCCCAQTAIEKASEWAGQTVEFTNPCWRYIQKDASCGSINQNNDVCCINYECEDNTDDDKLADHNELFNCAEKRVFNRIDMLVCKPEQCTDIDSWFDGFSNAIPPAGLTPFIKQKLLRPQLVYSSNCENKTLCYECVKASTPSCPCSLDACCESSSSSSSSSSSGDPTGGAGIKMADFKYIVDNVLYE
jgi:hypothetical protein